MAADVSSDVDIEGIDSPIDDIVLEEEEQYRMLRQN